MKYKELEFKKVINAAGKLTALGVSRVSKNVLDGMTFGATNFFEIDKMHEYLGKQLAQKLDVEDVAFINSASAGIVLSVAGVIGRGERYHAQHPYDEIYTNRNEIIIPKGHNVDFGVPVELLINQAGGKIKEAGYANKCSGQHIEEMISERTAGILYIKSHHAVQKSMISIQDVVEISRKFSLPLIVDAAAEEDIKAYYNLGADIVIYSGGKALEGPCSGLIMGRKEKVLWVKLQYKGIGRAMKIGKENILGLYNAVSDYLVDSQRAKHIEEMKKKLIILEKGLIKHNISTKIVQDIAGREIYRLEVTVVPEISATDVVTKLKTKEPVIYVREHKVNQNIIEIDVRAIEEAELFEITNKFNAILGEEI